VLWSGVHAARFAHAGQRSGGSRVRGATLSIGVLAASLGAAPGAAQAQPRPTPQVTAPETGDPAELGAAPDEVPGPATPSPDPAAGDGPGAAEPAEPAGLAPSRPVPLAEAPEPAALPEPPSPWATRPMTFEAHLGFGTPVGTLGVVVDYLVTPAFSLGGGVGLGSGPSDGADVHGAIGARARPAQGRNSALVLGAALSTGAYRRFTLDLFGSGGYRASATWAHFLQGDIGWEGRSDKGFVVRVTVGIAAMLNPDALCTPGAYDGCGAFPRGGHSEVLPTLDFALGQGF
jgi:hypothetical protein